VVAQIGFAVSLTPALINLSHPLGVVMQSIGFTGFLYVAIWVRPVVLRWILSQQDLRQLQRWLIILAGGLAIIMVLMLFLPTPSTLGGLALINLGLAFLVGTWALAMVMATKQRLAKLPH
jgi:hypothetical protein